MTVKEHYDKHLANFYSWMTGDFETKQKAFERFLNDNAITPTSTRIAIDLGAGHGLQSVPLARLGFHVIAIDFSKQLLNELEINGKGLAIEIVNDDIRNVREFSGREPELVVCCGDTLSHLDSMKEIENLVAAISTILKAGGKAIFSFRDYSTELTGDNRFIPVTSDDTRILTCVLDYEKEMVRVTDLLNERTASGWTQKVSSYYKVRVSTKEVVRTLETNGMKILSNQVVRGMVILVAAKG